MRRTTALSFALSAAAVAAALVSTGCQSKYPRAGEFANNPTPDLQTTAQRHIDVDMELARTENLYGRLFWEDLGRFGLMDRPSRLSPVNVVD